MGDRKAQANQPLRIVALEPAPARGLDCDGGACGFAPDAPIRFKFDRWLLPTTAIRQSVSLYTEGTQLGVFLRPDYDVTARSLGFRPDAPLLPDTVYILEFSDADKETNGFGFRSYDGDSLGKSTRFAFRTAGASGSPPANDSEPAASCREVLIAMAGAGCANAGCHSGNQPRMGLALDTALSLETTAIDHVAHQTESGTEASQRVVSGGRFGVQMPIIDPGRPENSYLIYKLLISRWLNRELGEAAESADAFSADALPTSEIEEARAWFIGFGAMPPDEVGYPNGVSPIELVRTIQGWIRAGAMCQ